MLAVAHLLGLMMAFFGLLYLLPIAWSLGVQDGAVIDFVAAGLINAFVGLAVAAATRRFRRPGSGTRRLRRIDATHNSQDGTSAASATSSPG